MIQQMSVKQLKALMDEGKAPLILDVREPWEFQICALPGAQLMPMRAVPARMYELDKSREMILVCHHGVRSYQVSYFLQSQGFDQVINLQGGMDAWAKEIDPKMETY